jgi:hypothetical protein
MSGSPGSRSSDPDQLRVRLEALPGVGEVDLSRFPEKLTVRISGAGAPEVLAEAIAALVNAHTGAEPEVRVELPVAASSSPPSRARFESIAVTQNSPGWLEATVVLDWKGTAFVGEADGEYNPAGELRVCASAALRAVEKVASANVYFMLVGVKELQVFDHNLIVVLLHAAELPERRLIGTAINSGDRRHAAALAALNATNRVMGRFLDG